MFQGVKNGWKLIKESIKTFNRHPKFIVPLLITWLIYAPIILYFKYWFKWDLYVFWQECLIVLGVIFVFAFLLSFSCSILLELIQQFETGQKMSVIGAFRYTLAHNTIRILPIVLVWTIIWFILALLQALLSKGKKKEKDSYGAENAAKTLAGYQNLSLSTLSIYALQKGVRMIVFLILPAIAWENMSFWTSVKKGVAVFKSNLSEFGTGYVLSEGVGVIMFFPIGILFGLADNDSISFPDWGWYLTFLYIAIAWSYWIYLEQMFTAKLYLWHLKWEKEVSKAQAENNPIPSLNDIPRPSVLDEVNDLL